MKKRLAAIIATVMILSMGVTAFANNIEARSPGCPDCGGQTVYDYVFFPKFPCEKCGRDGCGVFYWGWRCTSCNSFKPTELMGYKCELF